MSFIDRFIPDSFQVSPKFPTPSLTEQVLNIATRLVFASVAVFVLVAVAAFALRLVLAH
jgi:hypothetical protein